jgi:integrase
VHVSDEVLSRAYGAGLRVSEVASLKVDDLDSTRMLIRVEQGKGCKDRNAMLSPQLLALLRLWWKEGRPLRHAAAWLAVPRTQCHRSDLNPADQPRDP